jgi:hypothetical protein
VSETREPPRRRFAPISNAPPRWRSRGARIDRLVALPCWSRPTLRAGGAFVGRVRKSHVIPANCATRERGNPGGHVFLAVSPFRLRRQALAPPHRGPWIPLSRGFRGYDKLSLAVAPHWHGPPLPTSKLFNDTRHETEPMCIVVGWSRRPQITLSSILISPIRPVATKSIGTAVFSTTTTWL